MGHRQDASRTNPLKRSALNLLTGLQLGLLALLPGCAGAGTDSPASTPEGGEIRASLVVLMTDFGLEDDAVGLMRGVIAGRAPEARILDLTHRVPRFDVRAGSRLLTEGPAVYPPGSVFVIVVDPGVGTARRPIVARLSNGTLLVAPDNGVLSGVLKQHGPAVVREVSNRNLFLAARSATFHGRDVFAPVGGSLAAGLPFEDLGPLVSDYVRLEVREGRVEGKTLVGEVEAIDEPFGNVWTNLPDGWLERFGWVPGDRLRVTIGDRPPLEIPLAATFGDVKRGAPLVYPNSRGRVALALNMADFARTHDVAPGLTIRIEKK
jgi:S-adenosylmethionine hydrolase